MLALFRTVEAQPSEQPNSPWEEQRPKFHPGENPRPRRAPPHKTTPFLPRRRHWLQPLNRSREHAAAQAPCAVPSAAAKMVSRLLPRLSLFSPRGRASQKPLYLAAFGFYIRSNSWWMARTSCRLGSGWVISLQVLEKVIALLWYLSWSVASFLCRY